MAVDLDRAWYVLKGRLSEKRSWGTAQLHELMAEIEVDCLTADDELLPGDLLAAREPHARDDEQQDEATTRPATPATA